MKNMRLKLSKILLLSALTYSSIFASTIEGEWQTVDDESGKVKSVVKIYKSGDKLFGKIVEIFPEKDEDQNPLCDKCPESDSRKDKPMKGMEIIKNLTLDDGVWVGDDSILDPEKGKLYDCKIWVDENDSNKLNVRGYIGFFFRTQTWVKK